MNVVQEWPEPVVRVQTLADAQVIPERYIKPPSERPHPSSAPGGAGSVPIVDLGGLKRGAAERQATMLAVSDACIDWGFFQVVNHGVSLELMARMREVWKGFFDLPMEVKQAYANSPATFEGYGSRLGVKKGAILDWGDYYFLQLSPQSIKNYDKWPSLPASLRETTDDYGEELVKLCGVIQNVLSLTLGLDEGFLHREFGEAGAGLRVNYYPRCPQPDLTLGLSPHSDPGGLTILLTDDHVKGLQVRKGGSWITVEPIPDALVVNVGDQIQVLTNGTYKSVEHRVVVNAVTERLSMAFFYNPQDDLLIHPAKELVADDTYPMYKPKTFKEYKLCMRMLGPRGKTLADAMKAT
ncbi:hypothetical protein OPV22_021528 [Ensete ventricosum]|uniref:Fe2OG dioxygenase domain-containing protein n=1 Tax=Ensete ventricosum TaxID=4639 RepID=A0AAV8PAY6_ENSVE|nr:hypothetical protein OPV22_021528 [Ensete ventricosum]